MRRLVESTQSEMLESVQNGSHRYHMTGSISPRFARIAPSLPSVTVELAYLEPMAERPYNYMYEPPAGTPWQNCEYRLSRVQIVDARAISSPGIDVEGFELWDAPTSIVDLTDENLVRSRYYGEAAELAKSVTGADDAYVFDHLVRRREAGRPALSFGRHGDGSRPGAAGRIHNDYSEASGLRRLEVEAQNCRFRAPMQRFAIVNIWRSIGGKVMDTPLAMCDARSISAKDLVVTDMRYPNRTGEIYLVQQSLGHRWVYYSDMDRHEALVFKQYDSQVSGVSRFTPHTAFDLPDVPPNAPLRQSIEIRCLVTYGLSVSLSVRSFCTSKCSPMNDRRKMSRHSPAIEFWFELGSNYSYLSVMRIEEEARRHGVPVIWKPFLLGPIFKALGMETSPFVLQKDKGAYVWQDMVRQCRKYGLRWVQPTTFPRVGVLPARVALFGAEQTWIGPFCRKVMERNFALNLDINEPAHVASILTELSLPAVDILHQAKTERVKTRLREQTEEARGRGIFGAPTFFVGNEMFWGNDRLDDALQLAAGKTSLVGIRIGEP